MKKPYLIAISFTLGIGLTLLIVNFTTRTSRIAYVSNAIMLSEYNGVKEMRSEYERKVNRWEREQDSLKFRLSAEIESFQSTYESLPKNEKELQSLVIKQKQDAYIKQAEELQQKIHEEDLRVSTAILKQIDSFIQDYGDQNGYDIIIGMTDAGNLLYGNPANDITEDILKGLNDRYEGI